MGDSLIRIGTEVDGDPALACPHTAHWWPVFTALVKQRFGVSLEILQAAGSYSKSGATHGEGTSIDWRTWRFAPAVVNGIVALAREMGARATWYRTKAQGLDPHVHMALDCPCRSGADYQTAAVDAGYNGLGARGRGGRDTHPAPSMRRDYKAGIAWATKQLGSASSKPKPTTNPTNKSEEDELMALSKETLTQIATAVLTVPVTANGKKAALVQHMADGFVDDEAQSKKLAELDQKIAAVAQQLAKIAKKVGA